MSYGSDGGTAIYDRIARSQSASRSDRKTHFEWRSMLSLGLANRELQTLEEEHVAATKTRPTEVNVESHIAAIANEEQRDDAQILVASM